MIAYIDCNHCLDHFYDFDPQSKHYGEPRRKHNGTDEIRKRDYSCPPPCRTPKGCPNGSPEEPNRLTQQNQLAYQHYLECKAVGVFPDDEVVRQNAAIIRQAEEIAERRRHAEVGGMLKALLQ